MADGQRPAVFFDRDGTIMKDVNYCSDPKDVHVFAFVPECLRALKNNGYTLIMVTNQSGIGRGYFSWEQYEAVHAEVLRQLRVSIDATYVSPDPPGVESDSRKPAPGMVLKGAREHNVDLSRSIFVGDKEIDVECGRNANIKAIRVQTGFDADIATTSADWVAADFAEASQIILTKLSR
jgi:histidinol-phosphate phosphatase family domain/HAD-superfamily hydrolase, subfamily IIIA